MEYTVESLPASRETKEMHTLLALEYIAAIEACSGGMRRDDLRLSLINHLKSSSLYQVDVVLRRAKQCDLLEEVVFLHKKNDDHESALMTLLYDCRDYDGVELYCAGDSRLSIRMLNLCFYPKVKDPPQDLLEFAIGFLCRNVNAVDHGEVLRLVPSSIKLFSFEKYLTKVFSEVAHERRKRQIERCLAKSENLQAKCATVDQRRRNVIIDTETRCAVCGKRILDKVFYSMPNSGDAVVHYTCLDAE